MSKLTYINCQFCGKFFGFEVKDVLPNGTVLLTCPSCKRVFAASVNVDPLIVPQPAQTAPVDAPNEFDQLLADSES